jgi:hypothetical protein
MSLVFAFLATHALQTTTAYIHQDNSGEFSDHPSTAIVDVLVIMPFIHDSVTTSNKFSKGIHF